MGAGTDQREPLRRGAALGVSGAASVLARDKQRRLNKNQQQLGLPGRLDSKSVMVIMCVRAKPLVNAVKKGRLSHPQSVWRKKLRKGESGLRRVSSAAKAKSFVPSDLKFSGSRSRGSCAFFHLAALGAHREDRLRMTEASG